MPVTMLWSNHCNPSLQDKTELGVNRKREMASLRNVQDMKQSSKDWETYDTDQLREKR